jgi:hypothetical protein
VLHLSSCCTTGKLDTGHKVTILYIRPCRAEGGSLYRAQLTLQSSFDSNSMGRHRQGYRPTHRRGLTQISDRQRSCPTTSQTKSREQAARITPTINRRSGHINCGSGLRVEGRLSDEVSHGRSSGVLWDTGISTLIRSREARRGEKGLEDLRIMHLLMVSSSATVPGCWDWNRIVRSMTGLCRRTACV